MPAQSESGDVGTGRGIEPGQAGSGRVIGLQHLLQRGVDPAALGAGTHIRGKQNPAAEATRQNQAIV